MSTTLRFEPDAAASRVWDSHGNYLGVRIDGELKTADEATALGFVPVSSQVFHPDFVQANAFQVRGIIRRGDAQRFDPAELGALVRNWLAERGAELEHPDAFASFVYNYAPEA